LEDMEGTAHAFTSGSRQLSAGKQPLSTGCLGWQRPI
jgi:hypothetical protein